MPYCTRRVTKMRLAVWNSSQSRGSSSLGTSFSHTGAGFSPSSSIMPGLVWRGRAGVGGMREVVEIE